MHSSDDVAGMASDAKRRTGNRACMIMGVGRKIGGMAAHACPFGNGGDIVSGTEFSQVWSRGVTFGAGILVYPHGVISRVAGRDAGRGVSDQA